MKNHGTSRKSHPKQEEMTEEERELRRVEAEVLDQFHKSCGLLNRNPSTAITSILHCYCDILRGLLSGQIFVASEAAKERKANEGLRGLSHCLRWIGAECSKAGNGQLASENVLEAEAMELLRRGVEYDPLFNQHVAYSKKIGEKRLVEAEVKVSERTISFIPIRVDPRFFISQVQSQNAERLQQTATAPYRKLFIAFESWRETAQRERTAFQFDDRTLVSSGAIEIAHSWLNSICLSHLLDNWSMGDFTIGELRRVMAALYVASKFRTEFENHWDASGLQSALRSHIFVKRRNDLVAWIRSISDVPEPAISAIVSLLTLNVPLLTSKELGSAPLSRRPFVGGVDDYVYFVPRLFLMLDMTHMVVGALNSDPIERSKYDGASEAIASSVLKMITAQIRVGCLAKTRIIVDEKFHGPNGSIIKPDLVIVSEDGSEVLVIDVKNATPPFGVGDIYNDIHELETGWRPQLEKYLAMFRHSPEILSRHFGDSAKQVAPKVYGFILLHWPFPIPVEFRDEIGAIDWPSLRTKLTSSYSNQSFKALHEWILNRPDVAIAGQLTWQQRTVSVDDWTYRYSLLKKQSDR